MLILNRPFGGGIPYLRMWLVVSIPVWRGSGWIEIVVSLNQIHMTICKKQVVAPGVRGIDLCIFGFQSGWE
jgi:hypothetical protein